MVQILNRFLPSYTTGDALGDPKIRERINAYSTWPAIPQLYVDGEFIGGCDIVRELSASGELRKMLRAETRASAN